MGLNQQLILIQLWIFKIGSNITDSTRLTLGALNFTDEDPTWSDNGSEGYAFSVAGYNPMGTVLYGRLSVKF